VLGCVQCHQLSYPSTEGLTYHTSTALIINFCEWQFFKNLQDDVERLELLGFWFIHHSVFKEEVFLFLFCSKIGVSDCEQLLMSETKQ
jgi:hypothetical protein